MASLQSQSLGLHLNSLLFSHSLSGSQIPQVVWIAAYSSATILRIYDTQTRSRRTYFPLSSSFLCTSICQHMRDQHTVAMEHDQFSVAFHCLPWPKEAGSKRAQGGRPRVKRIKVATLSMNPPFAKIEKLGHTLFKDNPIFVQNKVYE